MTEVAIVSIDNCISLFLICGGANLYIKYFQTCYLTQSKLLASSHLEMLFECLDWY